MDFDQGLDGAVRLFEVAGVGILVAGGFVSVVAYARDLTKASPVKPPTRPCATTSAGRSCSASRS